MRTNVTLCAWLAVAGACASSQAEQVRDARMEQIDDSTVAQTRIIEDREHARNDNIDAHHELAESKLEARGGAKQEAAKQLLDVSKERATYQSRAQARVETIGVRIRAASQKLEAVGPRATVRMHEQLQALQQEHQLVQQEVIALPDASAKSWERAHEDLDRRLSDLNSRVKKLTSEIEGA